MTPDLLSVIVRALGLVALYQAVGTTLFLLAFGGRLARSAAPIRRLARYAAAVGIVLVLSHLALEPARFAGEFGGIADPELRQLAWRSASGASQLLQVLGLCAVLVSPTSAAGLVAVAGFLLTGHTSGHPLRAILAPLLALHLLIGSFWFGSLSALLLVCGIEPKPLAVDLLRRFSRVAGALVPLILIAGLAIGWILAGNLGVLHRTYGELLLLKLALFALLMLLAARNRWALVPAAATGGPLTPLRRTIVGEYGLVVLILATTAVLTAYFSPR
jgi:putative copper resistance protein D